MSDRIRPWDKKQEPKNSDRWNNNENYSIYNSPRWRSLAHINKKYQPLCVQCKEVGLVTACKITDHIIPIQHGGAVWLQDNFQSLCESCHNTKSAAEKEYPLYIYTGSYGLRIPQRQEGKLIHRGAGSNTSPESPIHGCLRPSHTQPK